MQMYDTMEYLSLYDVVALLYVQQAQLDKFQQELVVAPVSANVAHANHQTNGVCDQHKFLWKRPHVSWQRVW